MDDENIISSILGSVYWKNKDGVYEGGNDFAATMVGLSSPKELIGKTDYDLFSKEEADVFRQNDLQVMKNDKAIIIEEEVTTPSGKKIIQVSSKRPLKDRNGNIIGIIGNTVDITLLKETQWNLIIMQQKAELGEIAAQVAHDIRSPLQVLDALFGDMKNRFSDKESQIVSDAIKRINATAENLLATYRQNKKFANEILYPELIWLVLSKLVEEKEVTLSRTHSNLKLRLETPLDKTLSAKFEVVELQRILSNIINNAVEAFKDPTRTNTITLRLGRVDNHALIEIQDNGSGISAERVAAFNQQGAIESRGGHGLGLSHAYNTVKRWGGDLKMTSQVGHGTTLKIYLPLTSPPVWLPLKLELPEDTIIYLVDDDEVTLHRFTDILIKKGISKNNIHVCKELVQFIQQYQTDSHLHKFIFIDQLFVKTDKQGIDVLLENQLTANAVLMTNDFMDAHLKQQAIEHGFRLLPKPLFADMQLYFGTAVAETHALDYIVLDDLGSVTDYWELKAISKNINVKTFNNSRDFMNFLPSVNKDVKIYMDNDLGERITGLALSEQVSKIGFTNIYLMTSRDDINVKDYPWLTAVVGKKVPFDG